MYIWALVDNPKDVAELTVFPLNEMVVIRPNGHSRRDRMCACEGTSKEHDASSMNTCDFIFPERRK